MNGIYLYFVNKIVLDGRHWDFNAITESIDPGQPAHADQGRNILLIVSFLHIIRPYDLMSYLLILSQTTNFRLFQIERVSRQQFQFRSKWKKVLHTGRKHCRKRRNCSSRAISPFPTVFSKDLYCRTVKTRACLEKG